jgi:putative transposase
MGRALRVNRGGYEYHVLNRANARSLLFGKDADYQAFEQVLIEARQRFPMPILAYCLMPNHWHLLLWPQRAGLLSRFMNWLTLTHTQRWHAHYHSVGQGHAYQGRFQSFVAQADEHFLTVCRYVERHALRAGLVKRAAAWRWSSLWRRQAGRAEAAAGLGRWPVRCPDTWVEEVHRPHSEAELAAPRRCVQRGQPYGHADWVHRSARRLGLETTLRPRGQPRKAAPAAEKGS